MLDELQIRVDKLLDKNEEENREKYLTIKTIMANQKWYKKIDVDTCVSIFIDLEYTIEEAKEIYMQLKDID